MGIKREVPALLKGPHTKNLISHSARRRRRVWLGRSPLGETKRAPSVDHHISRDAARLARRRFAAVCLARGALGPAAPGMQRSSFPSDGQAIIAPGVVWNMLVSGWEIFGLTWTGRV
jgi:hypothetical protein